MVLEDNVYVSNWVVDKFYKNAEERGGERRPWPKVALIVNDFHVVKWCLRKEHFLTFEKSNLMLQIYAIKTQIFKISSFDEIDIYFPRKL